MLENEIVLYSAPTCCQRCGSILINVSEFGSGREWEINCAQCGALWWSRRRPKPPIPQRYRNVRPRQSKSQRDAIPSGLPPSGANLPVSGF